MTEPTPTTARVWGALPEHYRTADAAQTPTYPLRRYLSLIVDQLDTVRSTLDRINRRGPDEGGTADATSELADPVKADRAWLPWLAQFVGVRLDWGALTEAQARAAIADASAGWRTGTLPGLIAATRSLLTEAGYGPPIVAVDRDPGRVWHLIVRTAPAETPQGGDAVIAALYRMRVKAAGVVLTWAPYGAAWDVIESMFPTWDAVEAANPWENIESAHPVGA